MKNNISILYKYLMNNFMHQRQGWYNDYKWITGEVEKLRNNFLRDPNMNFSDEDIYDGVKFQNKKAVFDNLFANTGNGIASNGQSIFSSDNYETVKNDHDFLNALKNLIIEPSKTNHDAFADIWYDKLGKNNPVQTNRASTACNIDLSTTVDNGRFDQVFNWLLKYNYISNYQGEHNWYDKNVFLTAFIRDELKKVQEDGFPAIDEHWINIFIWLIHENLSNPFSLKKQVVKYGAPGTGKTYQAKEIAKMQFDIWSNAFQKTNNLKFEDSCVFVQFHPSYTYEDFMEGLRPIPDAEGNIQLKLSNGIFKQHCIEAGKWECDLFANGIKDISGLKISNLPKDKLTGEHWEDIKSAPDDSLLTELLPPYFVLIDEINRAELSRVFGELMYCLEYRGLKGIIKTQYAQLNTSDNGMLKVGEGYQFFIPQNLYIIASMNTVDRSVDSFDFALRRRFRWEEVMPDMQFLRYHLSTEYPQWVKLADSLEKLNKAISIEPILGKDYCIGHAYLWELYYSKSTSITEIKKLIWEDSIGALIEEYLRGSGKENLYHTYFDKFTK